MSARTLLSLLQRVKRIGDGRWIARCPAHEDKQPSLAIRELDDGRLLLHDFGGCAVSEVLATLGLDWEDIMPERLGDHIPKVRRPWIAADVLRAVAHETLIASLAVRMLTQGRVLTDPDKERLHRASERLSAAVEAIDGSA